MRVGDATPRRRGYTRGRSRHSAARHVANRPDTPVRPAPGSSSPRGSAGWPRILYLDRICMSQAVDPIQDELELSNTQMSYVLMAFTLAYGLFEVPTGRWGDRSRAAAVLTRIVVWWSVFTALTGAAPGSSRWSLVRFLFGAGEAGAFPNAARVMSRWFPVGERGRVQGVMLVVRPARRGRGPGRPRRT